MKKYATVVNITRDEDGGYAATTPSLPACISQGETLAQAQENLAEPYRCTLSIFWTG